MRFVEFEEGSLKGEKRLLEEIESCGEWESLYYFPTYVMWAKVDERGRVYLPKSVRSRIGREVFIVEVKDGILLIPKPSDPVKRLVKSCHQSLLRNSGRKLRRRLWGRLNDLHRY